MKISLASADDAKGLQLRVRAAVPWIAGVLALFAAGSALPQGNIDAGKSPAQMFSDTCSNCHRRPSELKRGASASFLRQHYTPGAQEAAAMASYLAGVPAAAEPRVKEKAKAPLEKDEAKTKAKAKEQQQAQERPKAAQQAQQQAPKGKRPELAKSAAEPAPEVPAEPRIEAATVPKLEPFEE